MQEISRENLVPGKEYYMQNFEKINSPPNKPYKMVAKFEKLEQCNGWVRACFSNFRKIENRNDPRYGYCVELNLNWRFYEIAQSRVQKTMESRAYNMVIMKIIKDEYFAVIDFI